MYTNVCAAVACSSAKAFLSREKDLQEVNLPNYELQLLLVSTNPTSIFGGTCVRIIAERYGMLQSTACNMQRVLTTTLNAMD